ncbi:MAG: SGNH/GDSL hydrolase family protein [Actinomycetota bacterium]
MRHRVTSSLIAAATVVSTTWAGAPSAPAGTDDVFYVSLGDSLAVGYQPDAGPTREGYVDVLWRSAAELIPGLARRKLGCPGEESESLITGEGSLCEYAEGSQLDAAVAFLGSHPGQTAFITIDIGSNELVDRCLDFGTFVLNRSCVEELAPELEERVTTIVESLRAAAGPDVPILGMTYYDPLLGLWGLVPQGRMRARTAQRGWVVFNAALVHAYEGAGAVVADVASTFHIDDFDDTAVVDGRRVPLNVALTCRWTWFCSEEFFGDPHANDTGYRKIARTFERALEPFLV